MTIDGTSSILFRLVLVKPFTDNHGINEHFPRLFFLFLSFFFFFTVDLLARFKGWHKLLPRLIAWWAFLNLRATRKRNRSVRGSILWIVTHTAVVAPYFLVSLTLSFHHLWGKRKNRGSIFWNKGRSIKAKSFYLPLFFQQEKRGRRRNRMKRIKRSGVENGIKSVWRLSRISWWFSVQRDSRLPLLNFHTVSLHAISISLPTCFFLPTPFFFFLWAFTNAHVLCSVE